MSVTNRAKDRDVDGRLFRKYRAKPRWPHFPRGAPKWWRKMFFSKPKRRENKHLCTHALRLDDPGALVFPVGNRRPQEYYW